MQTSGEAVSSNPAVAISGCNILCGIFQSPDLADHQSRDGVRSFIIACIKNGISHQPWQFVSIGHAADRCLGIATHWAGLSAATLTDSLPAFLIHTFRGLDLVQPDRETGLDPGHRQREVCVLLCFIKPTLGNRYGPGVSSRASQGIRIHD